jgi:hypothetical protein
MKCHKVYFGDLIHPTVDFSLAALIQQQTFPRAWDSMAARGPILMLESRWVMKRNMCLTHALFSRTPRTI